MQAGGRYGMRTMDQALAALVISGKITAELARQRCHDQQELTRLLDSPGALSMSAPMGMGGNGEVKSLNG
jgi:hypothetical protein